MKAIFPPRYLWYVSGLGLLAAPLGSCRHAKLPPTPATENVEAYVIGFDPCASTKGLVLVLPGQLSATDTVVTYTMPPGLLPIPPAYLQGGLNNFLFPPAAQRTYKVRVTYHSAQADELQGYACNGLTNLADYNRAVQGRQVVITAAQRL